MAFFRTLASVGRLVPKGSRRLFLPEKTKELNHYSGYLQCIIRRYSHDLRNCTKITLKKEENFIIGSRQISTTSPKRALPPFIVLIASRIAKIGAVFFGRIFRTWWKKLPAEKRLEYLKKASKNKLIIGGICGGIGLGSFIYYDRHIQETPITNRKRFVAFDEEKFNEISKHELNMIYDEYKDRIFPADMKNPLYKRVAGVTTKLLNANLDLKQIFSKEWTITVVNDLNQRNAFVLPCGSIFVFTGMLSVCDTDDQLGIILGHEMAHAILGHGAEQASFLHFLDMIFVLPIAAMWAFLPTDLTSLFSHFIVSSLTEVLLALPYGRAIEMEADRVGLYLAAKACFDVRQASFLWKKMGMIGKVEGEHQVEWLSTHPSHENREDQIEEMLPEVLKFRETCKCPSLGQFDSKKWLEVFAKNLPKKKIELIDNSIYSVPIKPISVDNRSL